jgi:hypothetical protein
MAGTFLDLKLVRIIGSSAAEETSAGLHFADIISMDCDRPCSALGLANGGKLSAQLTGSALSKKLAPALLHRRIAWAF